MMLGEHDRALQLLRRAIRYQPTEAGNLYILANILWARQQFQSAYLLYHFAACLEDKNERLATSYFAAARYLKPTNSALQFLYNRFQRLGKRSGMPRPHPFRSAGRIEPTSGSVRRSGSGIAMAARRWRAAPFAASKRGRHNQLALAEQLLRAAEDRSDRKDWLRAAASLAEYQGQGARSLELWQEIIASEPLAIDAHEECARLLAQTQGTQAVREHFEEIRRPVSAPLRPASDLGALDANSGRHGSAGTGSAPPGRNRSCGCLDAPRAGHSAGAAATPGRSPGAIRTRPPARTHEHLRLQRVRRSVPAPGALGRGTGRVSPCHRAIRG